MQISGAGSLIVEMTGQTPTDNMVNAIVSTFWALKGYAKFDQNLMTIETKEEQKNIVKNDQTVHQERETTPLSGGLNLSYTINLNLPETSDVEVFNAIFKSLKEHILRN